MSPVDPPVGDDRDPEEQQALAQITEFTTTGNAYPLLEAIRAHQPGEPGDRPGGRRPAGRRQLLPRRNHHRLAGAGRDDL
ncbi:hypothetical protein [Kineococcus sp. SYSU DK005]|uniref:hypothetical protein n=1 Tax=Kineococcus sp. SYSU DK005 TaxID=3383126 RepID=UPI003D7EC283